MNSGRRFECAVSSFVFLCSLLTALACGSETATAAADGTGDGDETGDVDVDADTGEPDPQADDTGGDGPQDSEGYDWDRAELRRLTAPQYVATLSALLDIEPAISDTPADLVLALFSNVGASAVSTSELAVEQYDALAREVTEDVFEDPLRRSALVGCDPRQTECVSQFIAQFGRRAWRRSLDVAERQRYEHLFDVMLSRFDDPWIAARYVTAAMLSSPNLVYLAEVGEPDPEDPSRLRYTSTEMASRLSYFAWDAPPDDELLDLAEAGQLVDADVVAEQMERMLADPRANAAMIRFLRELLAVDAVQDVVKDPTIFTGASPALFDEMRDELQSMVQRLVADNGSVGTLLMTHQTSLTSRLATLYGVAEPSPEGEGTVQWPDGAVRFGLLGTGAFLATNARVTRTSPTLRGLFVQQRLLCRDLPPPPGDVDADLPTPTPETVPQTMRELLAQHASDPACASCHTFMDPIGLALEHFDGIGRYRSDDRGVALDVSGELSGTQFEGLRGLATALAQSDQLHACVVRQVHRHAVGHVEGVDERGIIDGIAARGDLPLRSLWLSIATSRSFRFRGETP